MRALSACALVCVAVPCMALQYRLVDLGTLAPDGYSYAYAVNDAGLVVGKGGLGTGSRPFRWTASAGMLPVGMKFGSWWGARPTALSEAGHAAGYLEHAPDRRIRACVWQPDRRLFVLPLLTDDLINEATGVNSSGTVCGWGYRNEGPHRPFLWHPAKGFLELQALTAGTGGQAWGINDAGESVGVSSYFYQGGMRGWGVKWDPAGRPSRLDPPPGNYTQSAATDINRHGWSCVDTFGPAGSDPVLWAPDGTPRLMAGVRPGFAEAIALNSRLESVGIWVKPDNTTVGFYWSEATGIQDLNTLLDAESLLTGFVVQYAGDINNTGEIVGRAKRADGQSRAVLLVPHN